MDNKKIYEVAIEWEQLVKKMLCEKVFETEDTEPLLKDTYRICAMYCDKEMVPREMLKLFDNINNFLDGLLVAYGIDEVSSPSDCAVYNAIGFIIDALKEGFYGGKYEHSYPNIQVDDSNGKSHLVNLEKAFLESLIDSNR